MLGTLMGQWVRRHISDFFPLTFFTIPLVDLEHLRVVRSDKHGKFAQEHGLSR